MEAGDRTFCLGPWWPQGRGSVSSPPRSPSGSKTADASHMPAMSNGMSAAGLCPEVQALCPLPAGPLRWDALDTPPQNVGTTETPTPPSTPPLATFLALADGDVPFRLSGPKPPEHPPPRAPLRVPCLTSSAPAASSHSNPLPNSPRSPLHSRPSIGHAVSPRTRAKGLNPHSHLLLFCPQLTPATSVSSLLLGQQLACSCPGAFAQAVTAAWTALPLPHLLQTDVRISPSGPDLGRPPYLTARSQPQPWKSIPSSCLIFLHRTYSFLTYS